MKKIFLLAISLLCSAWLYAQNNTEFQKLYDLGVEALGKKDYTTATWHFQRAVQTAPDYPETHLRLIQCAILDENLGLFKTAIKALDGMRYEELNASVYLAYANIANSQNQYTEVLQAAQKGRVLEPDNVGLLALEGTVYKKQKQYAASVQRFERASQLDPKNMQLLNHLADAYLKKGDLTHAKTTFESILAADAKNKLALTALGKIHLDAYRRDTEQQGEVEQAISYYEKYTDYYPNEKSILEILKNLYRSKGDIEAFETTQTKINTL